mgnify:CR=1 FL=1
MLMATTAAVAQSDSIQPGHTRPTQKQINSHQLTGKATYYGHYRTTRKTASGETFRDEAYAAAHKTLPFGTVVKVTNKKNGKSVTVRINDRGPYGPGRVIDVTPKAAMELDMISSGVVPCEVEIISMPQSTRNRKVT